MNEFHTLLSGSSAHFGMTVTYTKFDNDEGVIIIHGVLTKVRYTNTTRKVQEASSVSVCDIGALALGDDRLDDTPEALRDVPLAELDERCVGLGGRCHGADGGASRCGLYAGRGGALEGFVHVP